MPAQERPSIFDVIGGRPAISAAVDIFYRRVLADADLAPFFEGVDTARLRGHQAAFLALALGGPSEYAGRGMAAAHHGLGIRDAHFDRVAHHLIETLRELNVPQPMIDDIVAKVAPLRPQIVDADPAVSAAAA